MQPHIINQDNNRNPEPMYENAQAPSFANILNDPHSVAETLVPLDMKNVLNNSVPKSSQNMMLPPLVDSNENTIADGNLKQRLPQQQHHHQQQFPQQIQTQPSNQTQQPKGASNGSINGLVQTMNEKLVVRTNSRAQQTPPTAWAMKKSTQSVAVSVVPSNNYPHNEVNAAKQHILSSNNSSSNINNIPIVPKVDEQQHQSSKVNATAATALSTEKSVQSNQDVTTQQSSEMQTVPVSDMQSEEPSIYANTNNNNNINNINASNRSDATKVSSVQMAPQTVASSTTAPAPTQAPAAPGTWAGLFATTSTSNAEQKKPIAKVSPYNTSHEPKPSNPPARATPLSTSNAPVLSYSSAASSAANGSKRPPPAKARIAPSAKPLQNSSESSNDESVRLGGKILSIFN